MVKSKPPLTNSEKNAIRAQKNMKKGANGAFWYAISTIVLPLYLFQRLIDIEVGGMPLGFTQADYENIFYWIIAIGSISTAITFFIYSSPDDSVRKVLMEVVLIILNMFFFYIFTVAKVTEFQIAMVVAGIPTIVSLDLRGMVYMSMGLIGLNILVCIHDLIYAKFTPIVEDKNEFADLEENDDEDEDEDDKGDQKLI
jgi:hypothetical protein